MKALFTPWRYAYIKGIKSEGPKLEGCPFCEILKLKDDPKTLILYRAKNSFVVMNRYPYSNGHLLILPNSHEEHIHQFSKGIQNEIHNLLMASEKILLNHYKCPGLNVGRNVGAAAGAGIPKHAHYHLVPRWEADTNFMSSVAGVKLIPQNLSDTYQELIANFEGLKL